MSVIPQLLDLKVEILTHAFLTPKPEIFRIAALEQHKSLPRLPRGVISKTSNGPYLPKHQDFARFLHRNTVSALYLQVSATGSWECKLMGKVTWSLAGISFPYSQRAWPYF